MPHKKTKKTPRVIRLANKDWARFCTAYHGRGPHRDKTVYSRRTKHTKKSNEDE